MWSNVHDGKYCQQGQRNRPEMLILNIGVANKGLTAKDLLIKSNKFRNYFCDVQNYIKINETELTNIQ